MEKTRNSRRKPEAVSGRERSRQTSSARPREGSSSNIVIQGSILAVTSIVVRLIGLVYRVPLIRILGDEGMAYYGTAFNVYSIMLLLSSYSLPLAVSKMIAKRVARQEFKNARRILRSSLIYATMVGGIGAAVVWFGADLFAVKVFKTDFCVYALKALAPTIWVMAYLGVYRGYFQGLGSMIPTAMSQLFEQIVNAVVSVAAAYMLFNIGEKSALVYGNREYPTAFGAAGGTIGTGAGALAALLVVVILYLITHKVRARQIRRDRTPYVESYGEITRVLCLTVVPVILSTAVYNLSGIVDNWLFANGMDFLGKGEESLIHWGIFVGKYQLLINVPMAVSNALSSSLIPSLSRAVATKSRSQIVERAAITIRFAMIVAIPATVGLTVLAGPVNELLKFTGEDGLVVRLTMIGSISIVFTSMSTVSNAILQGINKMVVPIKNAVFSLGIHVVVLLVLMLIFKMGIYSVVFANIVFAVSMCVLNNRAIARYLRYRQEWRKTFFIPSICAAGMGAAAYLVYQGLHRLTGSNAIGTLAAIAVAVVVYGVLLLKLKGIDKKELQGMPGGAKLARLCSKLRLL